MKNFIKLVNFELNRFFPIYATLGGLTILFQIIGVFVTTNGYLSQIEEIKKTGITQESQIISDIGKMGMDFFIDSLWFWAPVALCVVTLIIYSLFIWYRDWLGKNTFIYRLLMLPTERINLYFSKAVTIFLMVLGLIALQLVLIVLEGQLFSMLLPEAYFEATSINQLTTHSMYLQMFYPSSLIFFLSHYSKGFLAILVAFTCVLFERCFKVKGIFMAGLYAGVVLAIMLLPYWIQFFLNSSMLFNSEIFWISLGLTMIMALVSTWISHRLLNRKITV